MSEKVERKMRKMQALRPFGVGAIFDIRGESFVACDPSHGGWINAKTLVAEQLTRKLGVSALKEPPEKGLPYVRFPRWLFCPGCRAMHYWRANTEQELYQATCPNCAKGLPLVPMRMVAACAKGHLMDVPWDVWAHSETKDPRQMKCQSKNLQFLTMSTRGANLSSLVVKCKDCSAERSLHRITSPNSLRALRSNQFADRHPRPGYCSGAQPWQPDKFGCQEVPQVLQRGTATLYFPELVSSIDIPPYSDQVPGDLSDVNRTVRNHRLFPLIVETIDEPDDPLVDNAINRVATAAKTTREIVVNLAKKEKNQGEAVQEPQNIDLQSDEWAALITKHETVGHKSNFVTRHPEPPLLRVQDQASASLHALTGLLNQVVLVDRLREVRALTGFTRINPGAPPVKVNELGATSIHARGSQDWYPAVEVFGEGVFLTLNEERLQAWEKDVKSRVDVLERRRKDSRSGKRLLEATPRFVLLHTLAHLLIRRMSFESGYPAASLVERIYARVPGEAGGPQAGILIYTAAGDMEGTLGGLVRLGEPPRFVRLLLEALTSAAWCSSDPVCRESDGQGLDALNLAACHACSLVSETSCMHFNLLLDRLLLVGDPETDKVKGYFSDVIQQAIEENVTEQ